MAELAEEAAEGRPDDEAQAEGGPDHAEGPGPLGGLRDVGDEGIRRGVGGTANPRDQPPEKEPGDGRRERHEDVVYAEPGDRHEEDRPPAIGVREVADDGTA